MYGAAPMSVEKLKQAIQVIGPVMMGGYGQTEAPASIAFLPPGEHLVCGKIASDERLSSVGRPNPLIRVEIMERHPLGTQLFYPLQDRAWLVLVCTDPKDASTYRAFAASGRQGVNYARNCWHHPLLVLDPDSRFIIVDRGGAGHNLDEVWLDAGEQLELAP